MESTESRSVIMYNRGTKCVVRSIVCFHTLRKWWNGKVTMFLENPYPKEYEKVLKEYDIDIIHDDNPSTGVMVRSIEICKKTPYDRNLWLDTDTMVVGKFDEMFDYLDNYDYVIPHFAGWWSDGSGIAKRIKRYQGKCPDEWIKKALEHNPAINCGVFSFKRNVPFLYEWHELAKLGDHSMFIPDEAACQTIYPRHPEVFIAPMKFNVSVKHDPGTKDQRIIHFHGQKHVLDIPSCRIWKETFKEMQDGNIGHINEFLHLADKRLKIYMGESNNVTIVTACDKKYIEFLKLTYPNWRKYKNIDRYPVIVFVNGIDLKDPVLDFLRLPNVQLIEWDMKNVDSQREKMLSAFVLGTAKYVNTKYWLKLDADSFATNNNNFITQEMKDYSFCGHKWGYSFVRHIKALDEWAGKHWKRKLRTSPPMFNEKYANGKRYYHPEKRTISFIQLNSTKFTRWCAKLCKGRLPVPSQDTYMYYIADRFKSPIKITNFKRLYGFDQSKGMDHLIKRLADVERENSNKKEPITPTQIPQTPPTPPTPPTPNILEKQEN